MTPEAQRISIAEACPNTIRHYPASETYISEEWWYANDNGWVMCFNNDPLSDLNAMHEAERTGLVEYRDGQKWRDMRNEYSDNLWFVCAPIRSGEESGWGFPHFATAAQRAEAFLRTLNLWTT